EDLLLGVATRIGTPQRLRMLLLLTAAHELASSANGESTWTATSWRGDLVRQLFTKLDGLLRASGEAGPRRTRSVQHQRERVLTELSRRNLSTLMPVVDRLPRRYLQSRSPAFIARHLNLLAGEPLADGEVRLQAHRH